MIKSKWLPLGIVLAATITLSAPYAAQAQSTATEEIVVSQSASVMPTWDLQGKKAVLFHVVNPTDASVTFAVPDLGIHKDVPAGSDRTFYVDMSKMDGESLTYDILNTDDSHQLISGVVTNTNDLDSMSSSSIATMSTTTQNVAYKEPAAKPEPVYQTQQTEQTSATTSTTKDVRGYW